MSDIILHHYPPSPVSEKVRAVLGIKQLAWKSVHIPRLPPRPLLFPMTGGYRRTPVMQIGADIYCDSACVIRELQKRFPEPTLYPGGGQGMPWAVGRWTDETLFTLALQIIFAAGADEMPPEFVADRGSIYFPPGTDYAKLKEEIPHLEVQLRAQLSYINDRVAEGRDFLLGAEPGLPDAFTHYIVWFVNGRWERGPEFLAQFPALMAWHDRMVAIGHGDESEFSPEEALEVAKSAEPTSQGTVDPNDPQGLEAGKMVRINPLGYGTDSVVEGPLLWADKDTLAMERVDENLGRLALHFPRVGYRVTKLD